MARIASAALALLLITGLVPLSSARAEEVAKINTEQTSTITADCTITFPEGLTGREYRVTDSLVESYQAFQSGQTIGVDVPDGAQGLYLEWYDATSRYTVSQYDAGGAVLLEEPAQPFINAYYPLTAGAVRVVITMSGKTTLSTLAVYGAGDLSASVQRWKPITTADLLIVASTPVTALDEFFGIIATYAANHDVPTALVVMSRYSRTAQQELLASLWQVGYDSYPAFANFVSINDNLYNMVKKDWGRKPVSEYLKSQISAFSPKVIVTHTEDETAADGAAQYTGEYTHNAARDYDIQKFYYASDTGTTTLDYSVPLNGCGGLTVQELSAEAYAICPTRHVYESALTPTASFLLEDSQVGDDSAANDLFENIDTNTLASYVEPTPAPTPTPEPTPEPTPTPEPAQEPAAQPEAPNASDEPAAAVKTSPNLLLLFGIPAAGLVITIFLMLGYGLKRRRRRIVGGRILVSFLPLIAGVLASGVLYFFGSKLGIAQQAQETPVPTATAALPEAEAITPEPIATPEPTPTPEPEQIAPSASDEYYRSATDPAEVVVVDEEKGHWEYKTDSLSILIDRVESEYTNYGGKTFPLVYFVAHIRMRDVDNFRTVQSAINKNGAGAIKPWVLARRNKAVLMITGDNLTESDTVYKSILIRGGKVFLDSAKCDVLAMYPDMTLRIFSPGETNAAELLMDGVRDAFSFAPTIIRDGQYTTENIDHWPRIGNETNPRTGIGMIEPGHFVAIVVDGRQKDYSYGMRLAAFGELFVKEGCVQAYNLDGGVSACMLFMGEQLNRHGNKHVGTIEDTYQRRIPDGLVWGYSDLVPSEDDPIYNRGEGN